MKLLLSAAVTSLLGIGMLGLRRRRSH